MGLPERSAARYLRAESATRVRSLLFHRLHRRIYPGGQNLLLAQRGWRLQRALEQRRPHQRQWQRIPAKHGRRYADSAFRPCFRRRFRPLQSHLPGLHPQQRQPNRAARHAALCGQQHSRLADVRGKQQQQFDFRRGMRGVETHAARHGERQKHPNQRRPARQRSGRTGRRFPGALPPGEHHRRQRHPHDDDGCARQHSGEESISFLPARQRIYQPAHHRHQPERVFHPKDGQHIPKD